MSSILTNQSAIVALQTLKAVNSNLNKAQAEISTGKTVASAKDNAAVWAISKVMETDQTGFKTIQSNLNVGEAVVSTARQGAEKIVDSLNEIRSLAVGAYNTATTSEHEKIAKDIELKFKQIASVINGTQMNGVNLLSGSDSLKVLASLDRGADGVAANAINVENIDVVNVISGLTIDAGDEFGTFGGDDALWRGAESSLAAAEAGAADDADSIDAFIGRLDTAISSMLEKTAELGSFGKQITDQSAFIGKLADSLKVGIGSLVDADMEEASARLQALQTQQQLGIQSLSIANQAPSAILSLFR